MCESVLLGVGLGEQWLIAAYWIGLIVGGGLLAVSVLAGHGSDTDMAGPADAGGHFDADAAGAADATDAHGGLDGAHGADLHGGALALSKWFSLRFVVFFLAVFGAVGVILTHLTQTGRGTTLGLALVGGALVGQAVHQLLRTIRRTSGNSTPQPGDYVHKLARVTIAIEHPHKGEVALQVRNAERYVPAVAAGATRDFRLGDEVVVVAYRAGVAEVLSKVEFEHRRVSQGGQS